MSEPIEYEFTKLARFIARRNNCEHCDGTGTSWESVLFIEGGPSKEVVKPPCPHCSSQLPTEEPYTEEELKAIIVDMAKVHEILDKAGVWKASTFPPCSEEEFLDRIDDTAMALGD